MWKKSSYSKSNGNCLEWRASSYSSVNGQCVQVRGADVRDSKDPGGPVLSFDGSAWGRFLAGIKSS
jgi:hypothetical protein